MGGNTVAVSRLDDSIFGVAGVPVRSQRRHHFIPHSRSYVLYCQHAVDSRLRLQANHAVRPDPLVRNDLVLHDPDIPMPKEAKAAIRKGKSCLVAFYFAIVAEISVYPINAAATPPSPALPIQPHLPHILRHPGIQPSPQRLALGRGRANCCRGNILLYAPQQVQSHAWQH